MTWKEFKTHVDAHLAKLGENEHVEIWYIDTAFPDAENFEVAVDQTCGLTIG